MPINSILNYEEKKNIQNQVFESVSNAVECLNSIASAYRVFNLDLPMPSYANFRDAMFHYVKIYDNVNFSTVNGNVYALNEHLQRSIKDSLLWLLNNIVDWIQCFCIDHGNGLSEKSIAVKKEIDAKFPEFVNISFWSIDFFKNVTIHLEEKFVGKKRDKELDDICLNYCAEVFQKKDVSNLIELRRYLHSFKNHILKIRSASTIIEKPYSNNIEVEGLIKEIENFYNFMDCNNLQYTSFFAFVRRLNTNFNIYQGIDSSLK